MKKCTWIAVGLSAVMLSVCAGTMLCAADKGGHSSARIELAGSGLENLHRVDSAVYRCDQPERAGFEALEAYGIREVLNLRNHHSDSVAAEGMGLRLHHIEMRAAAVTEGELLEAMRVIRDRKGPIVVHCWHGSDRTGAVVAMYRVLFRGVSKEVAIRDMTTGGYGFHVLYTNLPRLIRSVDVDRMKRELGL